MFVINKKNLLKLFFLAIFSPLFLQATGLKRTNKNSEETKNYSEEYPTRISLAQLGFNNPFLCSAFLSTIGFTILNSLSKKSYSHVCDENIVITLLGWAVIYRLTHNYLINTKTSHKKTAFCTNMCKEISVGNQIDVNTKPQDEQLYDDSCEMFNNIQEVEKKE